MTKHVVIADNVELIRDALRESIKRLYEDRVASGELTVETFEGGAGVVSLCAATVPDLIIMDVDMPGMDGIEAFYRIREVSIASAANVVFLTGFAGSKTVDARIERAIADGACGWLPKPASLADIKELLDKRVFAV